MTFVAPWVYGARAARNNDTLGCNQGADGEGGVTPP